MLSALPSRVKAAAVWGLALAALALVPQSTVHAQGGGSFGPPGVIAAVMGAYYETGVTIKASVPADPDVHDIQISDRRRLHIEMFVKVDSEEMWITALSGDPASLTVPDVMTVDRAQNGTTVAAHSVNTAVKANVAAVNILVNNLTTDLADCDQDEEFYSGSDLAQDIDAVQTLVHISAAPQAVLTVGLHIRIDSEEMHIVHLYDYPSGTDPRMDVTRGVNGTTAAEHSEGTRIYGKTANPTPRLQCGLGAYRIDLHYDPAKARYISLVNGPFLGSTGRIVKDYTGTCFTPDTGTPGVVTMQCNTEGSSPLGPLGTGLVATALFEPLTLGTSITTLSMSGSFLMDILGPAIPGVSLTGGSLQSMTCPDTNADGWVNIADAYNIAKNFFDKGKNSGATIAALVDTSQTTIEISGVGTIAVDQVDIIDGKVDVNESGAADAADDLPDVVLDLAAGGTDQVDITDGKVDVDENGVINATDDLANVVLHLAGGGTDQVDIIDGQVDVDESAAVNAADDLSDVVLELVPPIVAVDAEQMLVNSLDAGPPATMEVERGFNSTPLREHQAGTTIYVASFDGNGDGKKGYTEARDTNPRVFGLPPPLTLILNLDDAYAVARVGLVVSVKCP